MSKTDSKFMKKRRDLCKQNRQKAKIRKLQEHERLSNNQCGESSPLPQTRSMGDYKSSATFGKAMKKLKSGMPVKLENQITVVDELYYEFHPEKRPKKERATRPQNPDHVIVVNFYQLDDVSQMLPGIRDKVKIRESNGNKTYVQRRVMLMSIGEALSEFQKQHPNAKVSKSLFHLLKPKFISNNSKLRYIGCLCRICENEKLLIKSILPMTCEKIENVDEMIKKFSCDQDCDGISCEVCKLNFKDVALLFDGKDPDSKIKVSQWKPGVKKMNLITEELTLHEVIEMLPQSLLKYKKHMKIKKEQQQYFKTSIEESTEEDIVVQFDWSEKFKCVHQDEIQAAYFNQDLVNVFTVAVWAGRKRFSKIFVTDAKCSGKYTSGLMIRNLFSQLKNDLPNIKTAKVFTDGCAAQFKNRWTLSSILNMTHFSGVRVEWNFFAPGHGKGAVDGIGGTAKRFVLRKILSRACTVQNARQFHNCMISCKGIQSTLVEEDDIEDFKSAVKIFWNKVPAMNGIAAYFNFTCGDGVLMAKKTHQSESSVSFLIARPKTPVVAQKRVPTTRRNLKRKCNS